MTCIPWEAGYFFVQKCLENTKQMAEPVSKDPDLDLIHFSVYMRYNTVLVIITTVKTRYNGAITRVISDL